MKYLNFITVAILFYCIGWGVARFNTPEKLVKIEVEKKQSASEDASKSSKRKSTKKTSKPSAICDGTFETTEETVDEDIQEILNRRWESIIKAQALAVENSKPEWMATIGIGYSFEDDERRYSLEVKRRIAGPLWAGLKAIPSDQYIEANASQEF
jgi:hypothetical protein